MPPTNIKRRRGGEQEARPKKKIRVDRKAAARYHSSDEDSDDDAARDAPVRQPTKKAAATVKEDPRSAKKVASAAQELPKSILKKSGVYPSMHMKSYRNPKRLLTDQMMTMMRMLRMSTSWHLRTPTKHKTTKMKTRESKTTNTTSHQTTRPTHPPRNAQRRNDKTPLPSLTVSLRFYRPISHPPNAQIPCSASAAPQHRQVASWQMRSVRPLLVLRSATNVA